MRSFAQTLTEPRTASRWQQLRSNVAPAGPAADGLDVVPTGYAAGDATARKPHPLLAVRRRNDGSRDDTPSQHRGSSAARLPCARFGQESVHARVRAEPMRIPEAYPTGVPRAVGICRPRPPRNLLGSRCGARVIQSVSVTAHRLTPGLTHCATAGGGGRRGRGAPRGRANRGERYIVAVYVIEGARSRRRTLRFLRRVQPLCPGSCSSGDRF